MGSSCLAYTPLYNLIVFQTSLAARSENTRHNSRRPVAHDRNNKARRRNGRRPVAHASDNNDNARHRSGHRPDADDRDHINSEVLDRWLENCPMAFLVLSGILFIIGLVFYLYVTQQVYEFCP